MKPSGVASGSTPYSALRGQNLMKGKLATDIESDEVQILQLLSLPSLHLFQGLLSFSAFSAFKVWLPSWSNNSDTMASLVATVFLRLGEGPLQGPLRSQQFLLEPRRLCLNVPNLRPG
ncbi:hypothetical protein Droror1_Dr00022766 [Drosera rotundifolia]